MRFRSFDSLRTITLIASHRSFSAASEAMNLSKGAISYQVKQIEYELGFAVFERRHDGFRLTQKGEKLCRAAGVMLDGIEHEIESLRSDREACITVATTTYFAARWLSPRLMRFTSAHPDITLRLQPTIGIVDPDRENIELVIRWGKGQWGESRGELLFLCPCRLVAAPALVEALDARGLESGLTSVTLLDDDQESAAWSDWCRREKLPKVAVRRRLVIPDPNVRLQAVIDGQGVAIFDDLALAEMTNNRLGMVGTSSLPDYGYHLVFRGGRAQSHAVEAFHAWLAGEAGRPMA
jgi:DNA-binding transcriptional LysR family regulator